MSLHSTTSLVLYKQKLSMVHLLFERLRESRYNFPTLNVPIVVRQGDSTMNCFLLNSDDFV